MRPGERCLILGAAGRIRPVVTATAPPAGVEDQHRRLREQTLLGRGALVF